MKPHELRRAEEIRELSDLHIADVQDWVAEQLRHAEPRIAAAARRALAGELAVWELVDLVVEHDKLETAAAQMVRLLDELPPAEVAELRRQTGSDADSLQAMVRPAPEQISGEARYHLERLGAFGPEIQQRIANDLRRQFNTEGLAGRLPGGRAASTETDDQPGGDPSARSLDPADPTNPFNV